MGRQRRSLKTTAHAFHLTALWNHDAVLAHAAGTLLFNFDRKKPSVYVSSSGTMQSLYHLKASGTGKRRHQSGKCDDVLLIASLPCERPLN